MNVALWRIPFIFLANKQIISAMLYIQSLFYFFSFFYQFSFRLFVATTTITYISLHYGIV